MSAPKPQVVPRWVSWILVAGAIVVLGWAWYLHGFLTEPSATGRVRLLLVAWVVLSALAAALGIAAAFAVMRSSSVGRFLATVAGAAMTLTIIGAVAGIPALLGVLWSRGASPN